MEKGEISWEQKLWKKHTAPPKDTKESSERQGAMPLGLPWVTKGQGSLGNIVPYNTDQSTSLCLSTRKIRLLI